MATKKELIKMLEEFDDDDCVICMYEDGGGWDNIIEVKKDGCAVAIIFGCGSSFSDDC